MRMFLEEKKIRLLKSVLAAREEADLSSFLSPHALSPTPVNDPFPHIVIDDCFSPSAYAKLEALFKNELLRGVQPSSKGRDKFHSFDIDYDGYKFVPKAAGDAYEPLYPFFSIAWNLLFSKAFDQLSSLETSVALHHHPPGDRTGFVHHDFAPKYFDTRIRLPNKVIPYDIDRGAASGTALAHVRTSMRVIALIFYVANPTWKEGDGGETGLYAPDGKTCISKIAPVNNRLLAFQISKRSMHAFQGNRAQRNSIVQWFHLSQELTKERS
ncbi:MAG: 2OG-Fe(II) oxygenase [Dehalococcoidia bacterium]|nr:MAG: 2OG-Fe(II) oxygenase [Dehalococcoidia bacterium]